MLTNYLALVSESPSVTFAETAQIAAAIQKQITRDFTPIWGVPATLDVFASLDDVPPDYWTTIIRDDIGFDAAGIHLDRNGQPYALVMASKATALTCSHEIIEMLVDPFGDRFVASQSIKPGQGRVNYLVEACDPCEGEHLGYHINGILVSDFYTPNFFDPVFSPSVRYSYTGAVKEPRQILKDGYISWRIPETGEWWQAVYRDELEFRPLGVFSKAAGNSWREMVDRATKEPLRKLVSNNQLTEAPLAASMLAPAFTNASKGWAAQLREDIDLVVKGDKAH